MAAKLLVSELMESDGTAVEEPELLLLGGVLDELLLHAAMTRQAATGNAAMTPFLALRGTGIIKPPRVLVWRLPPDLRGSEINVPLTSALAREDSVNVPGGGHQPGAAR
jgi:hypothetical protein